jgi:hypothetical protein
MDELGNHIEPRNQRGAADRLREMLAQTARDHAADQRLNTSVLEDMRQRVDGIAVAIASLADKVAALDTRLERLDERHDDQYDRLTSLEETLLLLAEALLRPGASAEQPEQPGGLTEPDKGTQRLVASPETNGGQLGEPQRRDGFWTEALPVQERGMSDEGRHRLLGGPEANGGHSAAV